MSKLYTLTIYVVALVAIVFAGKLIKITLIDNIDISNQISINTNSKILEPQKNYRKINIGSSMDTVLYEQGYPTNVLGKFDVSDTEKKNKKSIYMYISVSESELNKNPLRHKGYGTWEYITDSLNTQIEFDKNKKIHSITCMPEKIIEDSNTYNESTMSRMQEECKIYGISLLTLEEDVKKKLGNPSIEYIQGTNKTMIYEELNLELSLMLKKVTSITLNSTERNEELKLINKE